MRVRERSRLVIVLYHGVTNETGTGIFNYRRKFVSTDIFSKHLSYFAHHHTVLPLDEAVQALLSRRKLPPYPLSITFDDGYRNFLTHAVPLLKEHHFMATMFLTTSFVSDHTPLWVDRLEYAVGHGSHPALTDVPSRISFDEKIRQILKQLPDQAREEKLVALERELGVTLSDFSQEKAVYAPLDWDDVTMLEEHSMMFGAHSVHHPILSRLDTNRIREEVEISYNILRKKCRKSSRVFAYPNGQRGDQDERVYAEMRTQDFLGAVTTIPGLNDRTTDPLMLKRFTLSGADVGPTFIQNITGTHAVISHLYRHATRSNIL